MPTGIPEDLAGRLALIKELGAAIDSAVRKDIEKVRGRGRASGDRKLFDVCYRSIRYLDHAIRAIDRLGLTSWRLALLSWLGLPHIEWIGDQERDRYTELALSDEGALWWTKAFEVNIGTYGEMRWDDFGRSPPEIVYLGPYIPSNQKLQGRTVEVWARQCSGEELGSWNADGYHYVLELCIHASSRKRGGTTLGAAPHTGLTIRIGPSRSEDQRAEVQLPRTMVLSANGSEDREQTELINVESFTTTTPAEESAILLSTYLIRSGILSTGRNRGEEKMRGLRRALLMGLFSLKDSGGSYRRDRGGELDERELSALTTSLDRFRHPKRPDSLTFYLSKAHPRIMKTSRDIPSGSRQLD